MNNQLKGTKTEQNLFKSFAGEAQARNRYTYYSKIAKREGYEQIAAIFLATAENELEHAKLFMQHIGNTPIGHVDAFYPFEIGSTEENLTSGIANETEEFEVLYLEYENTAKEEGFMDIANTFHNIRIAERHHAKRYEALFKEFKNCTTFKKDENTNWVCRKCGYVITNKSAPEKCPLCHHPQAYFEVQSENY